jgi:hypothetical protein
VRGFALIGRPILFLGVRPTNYHSRRGKTSWSAAGT